MPSVNKDNFTLSFLYFLNFFKDCIYLFMRDRERETERERERQAQTQAEGEAGSVQGA